VIEACVVAEFSALAFGEPGAGSVTSGGTESNYFALLLARDAALSRVYAVDPAETGIPASAAGRLRILTSAVAHFSVARAAAQLGLGERAVVPVRVQEDHRIDAAALAQAARRIAADGDTLVAVVATAGTTDAGAIDPLAECADVARAHDAWFHVDAAYGGGLLLSNVRRAMLAGIELADSASVDLHKFGWQPIPAGLLLTRDPQALDPISRRVAYLSDLDDEAAGYPNLLGRSLRTTRRPDAVKILAASRHHGLDGYTRMIESCFAQTAHAAAAIAARPEFELALPPALTTVLFRFRARHGDPDRVNAEARRALLAAGSAVVGRTRLPDRGGVWLKLTLLRPETTAAELDALLDLVARAAHARDAPNS
jgi:L-2,4-diaminobutyrate decarboxylase